jgi:predicted nucleic-acid-binding protein
LLLNDDPTQVAQVRARLERATSEREHIWIGPIALAETVWTLRHRLKVPAAEIAAAVADLATARPFRIFDEPVVTEALALFSGGAAGFSDCLIRVMDRVAGCRLTLSFDQRALQLDGFSSPASED